MAFERAGHTVGRGVIVYDLGGGTFDAAFLAREAEGDRLHLALEPAGDARCGGDDIDLRLYEHFNRAAEREKGQSISAPGELDLRLLERCRLIKENLSKAPSKTLSFLIPGQGPFTVTLDRGAYEELIADIVDKTIRVTKQLAERAEAEGYQVDTLLLIGGSSQIPLITQRLTDSLGIEPQKWALRDVAVALGAAYHGETVWPTLVHPVKIVHWADPKALTAEGTSLTGRPRPASPPWRLSARVLGLASRLLAEASIDFVRADLEKICESLEAPVDAGEPVIAALIDAERAGEALAALETVGLRSSSGHFIREQVEQFRDGAVDTTVIELARWYSRVHSGRLTGPSPAQRTELELVLTGLSHPERLGLGEQASLEDQRYAIVQRVHAWRSFENSPQASPDGQRLARSAESFYERLHTRLESEPVGEAARA
jgi:hypothetical protein